MSVKQETFIQILDSVPEKEITHTCKPVFLTLRMAAHIRKLKKKNWQVLFFYFFFLKMDNLFSFTELRE